MVEASDIILILLAIFFPPAAVAFLTGCSCDLIINILLTILGVLPGTIHAFWLIFKKMRAEERYGQGGIKYTGNGEWVPTDHVQQGPYYPHGGPPPPQYGATNNY
ncbi:uncharacterized protein PFL1_03620 [Pseudozyma flocculosa PF-1]|uniref:Uncharacterized protein n=2 Tax=Pseudozyma flocculosa TaxID=84751 RepID=A0A5C3F4F9_9BASI|nr:uncharacterized protein PFL1_03620 [Pseudozyma flocculosa PF-1]EPQ28817.1 hypothetical protein PFL1_03620 [Pseudozyma flocculosa PF-1]SPO39394.1 uncharacterized protein PSFLO_04875 [Pseudozyma flocculosa]